jgi:hypothetical protein
MLSGRPVEAVRLLDDALDRVARSGERMYEADLRWLRDRAVAYSSSATKAPESSSAS